MKCNSKRRKLQVLFSPERKRREKVGMDPPECVPTGRCTQHRISDDCMRGNSSVKSSKVLRSRWMVTGTTPIYGLFTAQANTTTCSRVSSVQHFGMFDTWVLYSFIHLVLRIDAVMLMGRTQEWSWRMAPSGCPLLTSVKAKQVIQCCERLFVIHISTPEAWETPVSGTWRCTPWRNEG